MEAGRRARDLAMSRCACALLAPTAAATPTVRRTWWFLFLASSKQFKSGCAPRHVVRTAPPPPQHLSVTCNQAATGSSRRHTLDHNGCGDVAPERGRPRRSRRCGARRRAKPSCARTCKLFEYHLNTISTYPTPIRSYSNPCPTLALNPTLTLTNPGPSRP